MRLIISTALLLIGLYGFHKFLVYTVPSNAMEKWGEK